MAKTVWIVGAGAIGSAIAGKLRPEHRCVIVDGWDEHLEAVREEGLIVEYPDGPVQLFPPAYRFGELEAIPEQPDMVFLAEKAHRTAECLGLLQPRISGDVFIVSLQNGVNEELIARRLGRERTVGAVVDFAAELLGPGRARGHGLEYGVFVGELDGAITPRLSELTEMIDPSIPVEATDDIWGALWSKLVANVQLNALCALTGLPTDEMAGDRVLRRLSLTLAAEAVRVATRLSIALNPSFLDGPLEVYLDDSPNGLAAQDLERAFVERWSGESFRPSMLQDVEKGRPTEIEALNGYVVEKGQEVSVPVPVNEAVVGLVKAGGDRSRVREELGRLDVSLPE